MFFGVTYNYITSFPSKIYFVIKFAINNPPPNKKWVVYTRIVLWAGRVFFIVGDQFLRFYPKGSPSFVAYYMCARKTKDFTCYHIKGNVDVWLRRVPIGRVRIPVRRGPQYPCLSHRATKWGGLSNEPTKKPQGPLTRKIWFDLTFCSPSSFAALYRQTNKKNKQLDKQTNKNQTNN